ncbi:ribonuclease G [Clostridium chromiireducens]|uniref:Ribonuclease G n=1 Tax=Clostridium chromiireducens TaxID=225345 RepID=A0A1V4IMI9_9CLOT|nr:ribonuclease G [Clostridium chromiireducens]MVX66561.1 ribonuclease G [Clostridium chromiireducens]OPJ61126.1 hypothetical protein CLCHR_26300 [Clostridium chromiireducens]RII33458.1 ribonuclease G [Clostridium chromiireducens]
MENSVNNFTNGQVPQEIKKWNWGAFMFNIFWGIGNKSYLPLLCLVPLLNIVWIFVCGAKGNEWAWKNGNYSSPQEFLLVQSTWSRAGLVAFIVAIVLVVLEFLFLGTLLAAIFSSMPR